MRWWLRRHRWMIEQLAFEEAEAHWNKDRSNPHSAPIRRRILLPQVLELVGFSVLALALRFEAAERRPAAQSEPAFCEVERLAKRASLLAHWLPVDQRPTVRRSVDTVA